MTGLAIGLFLYLRSPSPPATPVATPSAPGVAAPTAAEVGGQTLIRADTVEVLSVVATSPTSTSIGAAANTAIDLTFNLPVDPAVAQSYFSVLPAVEGSFSQGTTPQDIVFTPSGSFGLGSSVNVLLRKGYTSRDGHALQDDYSFSFITAVSPRNVMFFVGDKVSRLYSAQSGHSVTVTLQFGEGVPAGIMLETFRATTSDLLGAQVHEAKGGYLEQPIATDAMQPVGSEGVTNGGSYTVTRPDGVYLLLAADSQGQYGAMWLDISRFGVILRQDDQKIVVAGEDLTTGATTPTFDITFYDLEGSVKSVLTGSFTGTAEFAASYPSPIDLAVATSGGEDIVIPIAMPQTNADIKVISNLSEQPQIFLTTDRAGYQQGDTVRFAGVVRLSNDQVYTVPTGMAVAVWSGYGTGRPVDQTAPVAADGTFSGSFTLPSDAFNADGTDRQMTLYAGTLAQAATDFSPFSTVFAALGSHAPAASISVTFDRSTYVASDTIVAAVSGVDSLGKPLAAQSVSLTIYSTVRRSQPSELDDFAKPNSWGLPVQDPVSVPLDAQGHATYTFKANAAQTAGNQEVTLTATYGSGAAAALGSRTAIIYQAANEVFLLPSRTVYQPGDSVIAPFVVESTGGQRVAAVPVAWEFDMTDYADSNATTTVVASGTLTTDGNGLGTVRTTYSGPPGGLVLLIKGTDKSGNVFQDAKLMTIVDDLASVSWAGPTNTLMQLSVTTDKIAYATGDTAHLVVTSPAAVDVLLSLERGRIHLFKWVSLAGGDNPLALAITPDLAPGFTLTFSYFLNGAYFTEGLPISVNNSDRLLTVTLTPDRPSYVAGQTAHVAITVIDDSGKPVAATLLVDGYDAAMSAHKLVDQGSIAGAFLSPASRATNGSSSLVGIGSWGGGCGISGGGPSPAVTNPGQSVVWLTMTTGANGSATIDVPNVQGPVRITLFATTSTTSLGQAQIDLNVQ